LLHPNAPKVEPPKAVQRLRKNRGKINQWVL
jgi:hypothetical protein